MTDAAGLPDVAGYLKLVDGFLGGALAAEDFAQRFIRARKDDPRLLGDPVGPVIGEIFLDSDEYVDDPRLRGSGPYDIDEPELRRRVTASREKLRAFGME